MATPTLLLSVRKEGRARPTERSNGWAVFGIAGPPSPARMGHAPFLLHRRPFSGRSLRHRHPSFDDVASEGDEHGILSFVAGGKLKNVRSATLNAKDRFDNVNDCFYARRVEEMAFFLSLSAFDRCVKV